MPPESAEKLAERLLVLTLLLESAAIEDLTPILAERDKIVHALEAAEKGPEVRDLFLNVMRSEQRALQRFAAERAETVRELDFGSKSRRLPSTYALSRRPGLLIDSSG